jgi:hypothetical protein
MKFGKLREMHQLSAVGKVTKAGIDKNGLYLSANVVDDNAWKLVKSEVYRGFSVGGKVTGRDPHNHKIITGIRLDEISLVDRPQNPDAVIDVIKSAVVTLPSATGRSIEEMWADLHEAKMLIDGMDDADPRKHEARTEHQRAVEKTLAHQFALRKARRKLRTPDPVKPLV